MATSVRDSLIGTVSVFNDALPNRASHIGAFVQWSPTAGRTLALSLPRSGGQRAGSWFADTGPTGYGVGRALINGCQTGARLAL